VHGPGVLKEVCKVTKGPVGLYGVIGTETLSGIVIAACFHTGNLLRDAFIGSHDYKTCYCGSIYHGKVGTPVSRARFVADSI
jgi:hypothetical protein